MALKRITKSSLLLSHNKEIEDFKTNPILNCSVETIDSSNLFHLKAYIHGPEKSFYAGGLFELDIHFPTEYPFKPLKINFLTKIYHPGIDSYGKTNLYMLRDGWSPAYTLSKMTYMKVLMMIYFMLEDKPCAEEPLMPEIAYLLRTDPGQYEKNAKEWTQKYAMGSSH